MCKNILDLVDKKYYEINLVKDKKFNEKSTTYNLNIFLGQKRLIRALIIALVGRHHFMVSGVKGTGKSLCFRLIQSVFPNQNHKEMLLLNSYTKSNEKFLKKAPVIEIDKAMSINDFQGSKTKTPFLDKHIGSYLLFDEINLYSNKILDSLKSVMDSNIELKDRKRFITIFANCNLCPCGNYGSKYKKCFCSMGAINSFKNKIKKPFLERFHIRVSTDSEYTDNKDKDKYNLEEIKEKIKSAWIIQEKRYKNSIFSYNGFLNIKDLSSYVYIEDEVKEKLDELIEFYKLSLRQKHNIIKVARSIADYEETELISIKHISEALSYQIN